MGLKRQLERLYELVCIGEANCHKCKYALEDSDYYYLCPFDNVIQAAEDRAKESEG